jgi:Txe/YoeB family toxin of Txe-Axe toxin-antitoxin module
MKSKKPLRVGFDLDGVVLYNPARTARPLVAFVKRSILRKKKTLFYVPKSGIAKLIWLLLHQSSFIPAKGLNDIKKLIESGKIDPYIITGRYASLVGDFEKWTKRLEREYGFTSFSYNRENEQPHIYKKRMMKEMNLDIFIEDNWDIVRMIKSSSGAPKTKIFWITNPIDKFFIGYENKFNNMREVARRLNALTDSL